MNKKTMVLAAGLGLALAGFGAGAAPKADVSEIGRLITVSGERVELDAASPPVDQTVASGVATQHSP